MCSGCAVPRSTTTQLQKYTSICWYISIIFFSITIKHQFSSMKPGEPMWFTETLIIHASWCLSQAFIIYSQVPHSLFLRGKKLGLTKVSLGQCLLSWSHQAERASGSLSKGSLDIKTYHASLPSVETWHLFQKMPNVFSLHICCHISDLSLVRSLCKKEISKQQADLSVSDLLGHPGWLTLSEPQ